MLAFALVFAQSAGVLHRMVHAPMLQGHTLAAGNAGVGDAKGFAEFSEHLFDGHASHGKTGGGSVDCQLLDQYSHFDGLCQVQALALPMQLPYALPGASLGLIAARWLAAFHARGPPALR